jgi:hypothetical protein
MLGPPIGMEVAMNEHAVSRVVRTNAGMCGIWRPESFDFDDFEDWEDWATEDRNIAASVASGLFVPINVGGDGVFQIAVRWGQDTGLTASERQCLLAASDPYLLVSDGRLVLGGLEDVGDVQLAESNGILVDPGRYAVTVNLIDWKADPPSVDASGKPTENALPDFVVIIESASDGPYRTAVKTFGEG